MNEEMNYECGACGNIYDDNPRTCECGSSVLAPTSEEADTARKDNLDIADISEEDLDGLTREQLMGENLQEDQQSFETFEEVVSFSGSMGKTEVQRLEERLDEAWAKNRVICLDLSEVGWISLEAARTVLSSGMPFRISEPVRRVMQVVDQ